MHSPEGLMNLSLECSSSAPADCLANISVQSGLTSVCTKGQQKRNILSAENSALLCILQVTYNGFTAALKVTSLTSLDIPVKFVPGGP